MPDEITMRCARCGLAAEVPASLSPVSIADGEWEKCPSGVYGVISCPALNDAWLAVADAVRADAPPTG
ncbi:hypothetical protein PQJ75_29795 [Rhodoplanes sp. TEM]|uniref:Ferredoxin n=1 Tax=Rhodoplanes tepidamans TaxID=200616 RepID=A0ABT5JHM2_RHOTP|nr:MULTISPECIES: hypothetical protein [Rhodoplanes]MDC7788871.1 hypothetical protein [Rhodoplanes tepidamans]MDC7987947.1 hypothetical protein [Rhodoplanes sp. TEM]MDQ0355107.1 hypothetical protein [Rhodoplanes tepidamans]